MHKKMIVNLSYKAYTFFRKFDIIIVKNYEGWFFDETVQKTRKYSCRRGDTYVVSGFLDFGGRCGY